MLVALPRIAVSRLIPDNKLALIGRWVVAPNGKISWEATGEPGGTARALASRGPGSSLGRVVIRKRHDPGRFLVFGSHQRSCGKSTPIVQVDLDRLGIEKWTVTGGPWGTVWLDTPLTRLQRPPLAARRIAEYI